MLQFGSFISLIKDGDRSNYLEIYDQKTLQHLCLDQLAKFNEDLSNTNLDIVLFD